MSSEQKQVEQLLANKKEYVEGPFQYTEGTIQNNTVILMKCGIGKVNAAAGTVELIRNFHPDCIISTGVAGGIDSGLKVMDVVAGSQIVYHDVWCGEGNAYGQIQGLPALFPMVLFCLQAGRILPEYSQAPEKHKRLPQVLQLSCRWFRGKSVRSHV